MIVSGRLGELADDLAQRDQLVLFGRSDRLRPRNRSTAVARPDRLGLVLGDEDQGIEPEWLERCCRKVTIAMRGEPAR